jgi:hypothetical protein
MYGINVLATTKVINIFTVCIDGDYKIVLLLIVSFLNILYWRGIRGKMPL